MNFSLRDLTHLLQVDSPTLSKVFLLFFLEPLSFEDF